ncbi:DUF2924 domain-containing protein [Aestuariivirga sp.]|uniref:DUF2924 domain-containing protein n=1 Tax=Aestuariivirga sp. TaxID=2650926 RepID=UPI00391918BE
MACQKQHGIGKAAPDTEVGRQLLQQIHMLQDKSIAQLKSQWKELISSEPPRHAKRSFLTQTIAWELKANTFGKLKPGIHRQLLQAGRGGGDEKPLVSEFASPILRPGVKLIRVWKGVTHHVLVTEDGFLWQERSWRSLSVIAREISGTPWSGPVFFGLKKSKTVRDGMRSTLGVDDGIGDHSLGIDKVASHG